MTVLAASSNWPGKIEIILIRLLSTLAHLPKFDFKRLW
jgi:hypothetical protein